MSDSEITKCPPAGQGVMTETYLTSWRPEVVSVHLHRGKRGVVETLGLKIGEAKGSIVLTDEARRELARLLLQGDEAGWEFRYDGRGKLMPPELIEEMHRAARGHAERGAALAAQRRANREGGE